MKFQRINEAIKNAKNGKINQVFTTPSLAIILNKGGIADVLNCKYYFPGDAIGKRQLSMEERERDCHDIMFDTGMPSFPIFFDNDQHVATFIALYKSGTY